MNIELELLRAREELAKAYKEVLKTRLESDNIYDEYMRNKDKN